MKYYIYTNTNLLSVNKLKVLHEFFPTKKYILDHLKIQKNKVLNGEQFEPIEVTLEKGSFNSVMKEIKRKTGENYSQDKIFVVSDSNSIPLIVFICTKEKK